MQPWLWLPHRSLSRGCESLSFWTWWAERCLSHPKAVWVLSAHGSGVCPPPCWRQPVPGLQVVKGNHASWCHSIPLHYRDTCVAWVAQHVTLSTYRNGLEAASSPRPAISLFSWQMPCSCSLCALLGVLTPGLCHSHAAAAAWQRGTGTLAQSSRPSSVQSPSHMTIFSSCLTWKRLFGSSPSQFSKPYLQRQTAQGGKAGDKQVS